MQDSLMRAMRAEPERFLRYVDFSRIQTPEDFVREFSVSFDTVFGRNLLESMTKEHWGFLLNLRPVQTHFKTVKQLQQLKDFTKQDMINKIKSLQKKDVKFTRTIEVKDSKRGVTYKRSYNKWSDKQEEFLRRNKKLTPKQLTDLYNKTFKTPRSYDSISTKLRRL